MKTANNYDEWVKVKSKKEINALNPKSNDLIWYAELCPHHKTHPSACTHHQPITLKEFLKRRNRKQRKKIKKVYYHRNLEAPMGIGATIQHQTQQNVAVIANFIVVLLIMGYIWFDIRSHRQAPSPQVSTLTTTTHSNIGVSQFKPQKSPLTVF
jgi:hypothetical protein